MADMGYGFLGGPFPSDTGIDIEQEGTGYSFNLISVTGNTTSGNLRGWRVNMTTQNGLTHGDLQCVHGYLTLGSSNTLGTGAAVYPLSAWIDVPSDLTIGSGNVMAGLRVIWDGNGLDLSTTAAMPGGGESALIYAQTWASGGKIFHGLRLVAGASSTIKNYISIGGAGHTNTTAVIDATDWGANTTMLLLHGGPKDTVATAQFKIAIGDANGSAAAILADIGASAYGSIYLSTAGELWQNAAGTWTQIS